MKKHIIRFSLGAALIMMALAACEKEYDTPPPRTIPQGQLLNIGDIRQILADSGTYKFTDDFNLFATVTGDGVSGNFYKNVYIQDTTSALNMRTIQPDGLYEGDYIRINLNGAWVSEYAGMLQLDSVDIDEQVVIQANNQFITPKLVTLDEIDPSIQAQLVTIENVEFIDGDIGSTYADAVNEQSENRTLQDCDGNMVLVRTSGFADFAGAQIPGANGTFTGIVGQFNNDMQLFIRTLDDVDLTELRCDGSTGEYILFKNFEDESISSGGWTQEIVVGSDDWYVDDFSNNFFAKVSNFNGSSNDPSEVWYISPAMDLTTVDAPTLSFMTMMNYDGPQLETYVSTNYSPGGGVGSATWESLSANYSPGNWDEVQSGPIDLSAYSSASTYVAFRYTGSGSNGSTWELDNIAVFGQ